MLNHNLAGKLPYTAYDVVVVGASAGGIQALIPLLANLPPNFPSPVVVVVHLPPASRYVSTLPAVLQRKTSLPVKWAQDGEALLPGVVYIAPQDRSTVINAETGCLQISTKTKLLGKLPAADPLFISAALTFGSRSLAVVLSGVLTDGAHGAAMIAGAGGRVLTQSAAEALFAGMPNAAMQRSQMGMAFGSISLALVIASLVMSPGVAAWFAAGKSVAASSTVSNGM